MRLSSAFFQLVGCALFLAGLTYAVCVLLLTRQTVFLTVFCLVMLLFCAALACRLRCWPLARWGLILAAVGLAALGVLGLLTSL